MKWCHGGGISRGEESFPLVVRVSEGLTAAAAVVQVGGRGSQSWRECLHETEARTLC